MNCDKCNKNITDDIKCALCVEQKPYGWKTKMLCGKCHTKEFDKRGMQDMEAIANECKSLVQLRAAWDASIWPKRWKRIGHDYYYNYAIEVFKKRKACFER